MKPLPCTVCCVDAGDRLSGVRLAELVAALSLATDLGLGQPQEHVLRQTVIARRLAAAAGLADAQQAAVFYVSLLAWVGCVADSHELAAWFGDDQRLRASSYEVDKTAASRLRFALGHVGEGLGPARRLTMIGRFLAGGPGRAAGSMLSHCQATGVIAERLGLSGRVGGALQQAFERWDGKGVPGLRAGEQIDPVMRVVQVADDAEVFHRLYGAQGVREMLRSRRGTEFDPALVDLFCTGAAELLDGLDEIDAWDAVTAYGDLGPELSEAGLTQALGGGQRRAGRGRAPRPASPDAPVWSDPPRGRDPGPASSRPHQQGDSRAAVGVGPHGAQPRRARLRQDRSLGARRRRHVRDAARPGRHPHRRLTGISGKRPMRRGSPPRRTQP